MHGDIHAYPRAKTSSFLGQILNPKSSSFVGLEIQSMHDPIIPFVSSEFK